MKGYFRVLAPLALFGVLSLGGCALVKLDVSGAVGSWSGNWNNTTFASTGTATMEVTQDTTAKTLSIVLDLNGGVFGGGDPAAQTIGGSYTDAAVSVDTTTPLFHAITMSVNNIGAVSGTAHPTGFDSVTFSGTFKSTKVDLTYKIYQPAGTVYASGTLVMTKP